MVTQAGRGHCPSCGAALYGRYCSECGQAADRSPAAGKVIPWPYVIAGALVALLAAALVIQRDGRAGATAPPMASAPPVAASAAPGPAAFDPGPEANPPDLSTMTPRERFDRLFDRVMRASEGGDTATVTTFSPMALAAYGMLDAPDIDARFHAGLIRLATGDLVGATVLADAIASEQPAHLFGSLLRARAAELAKDPVALGAAERAFQAAYAAETTTQRPEYDGHRAILDRFFQESSARATSTRP